MSFRRTLLFAGLICVLLAADRLFRAPSVPAPKAAKPALHSREATHSDKLLPAELASRDPWRTLLSEPPSPQRAEHLCRFLQNYAASEPQQAIARAVVIGDVALQRELVKAALRGWASTDIEAAGAWAFSQAYLDFGQAFSSIFNGANRDPQKLLRYAQDLIPRDSEHTRDLGHYLIFALSQAGENRLAADFAAAGDPFYRAEWLTAAYCHWGRQEPEEAAISAAALFDPALRQKVFVAAISGWAQTDPARLATDALGFPPGPEKTAAISLALREWVTSDPRSAAEWIVRHGMLTGLSAFQWKRILDE